jgi:hypothetical protein
MTGHRLAAADQLAARNESLQIGDRLLELRQRQALHRQVNAPGRRSRVWSRCNERRPAPRRTSHFALSLFAQYKVPTTRIAAQRRGLGPLGWRSDGRRHRLKNLRRPDRPRPQHFCRASGRQGDVRVGLGIRNLRAASTVPVKKTHSPGSSVSSSAAWDVLSPANMVTKSPFLGTVAFLTAAAAIGFAAPARAQSCASDGDCPQSYTCVTSTVIAEPAPACPPGADCAKPEVDASVPPTVVKFCEPKTCSVDKDCGAGMVCYTQTAEACSGGVAQVRCAANTECDAGAPTKTEPTCTTTTTSQCAFKWQLPCKADTDCGDGFACQPNVSVGCSAGSSGGAGTPSHSGSTGSASGGPNQPVAVDASVTGVPTPPPSDGGAAPICVTTTSLPGYCQPKASTCTTDTDCPATWKCEDILVAVPVASQPANQPSTGGAAGGPAELVDADLASDAGAKACVSPVGGGYGYPTRGGVSSGSAPETTGTGNGNADAGVTTATPPGATAGASASTSDKAASSSSGCSLAGGGAEPTGLMLLALVVLTRARRRSR